MDKAILLPSTRACKEVWAENKGKMPYSEALKLAGEKCSALISKYFFSVIKLLK